MSAADRVADIRERLHDAMVNGFPDRMNDHAADDIRWLLDALDDANDVIYGDSREDFIKESIARRAGK